jgi:hypothetical protein
MESFPLVGFLVLCATVAALPVVQPHWFQIVKVIINYVLLKDTFLYIGRDTSLRVCQVLNIINSGPQ